MSLAQPDWTASPMTLTPRDEYSFSSLLNSGISLTQFSHQVAQKSSTTILSQNAVSDHRAPVATTAEQKPAVEPLRSETANRLRLESSSAAHQLCRLCLQAFCDLIHVT